MHALAYDKQMATTIGTAHTGHGTEKLKFATLAIFSILDALE